MFPVRFLLWRKFASPIVGGLWMVVDFFRLSLGKRANLTENIADVSNFATFTILELLFVIPSFFGYDVLFWEYVGFGVQALFILIEFVQIQLIQNDLFRLNSDRYHMRKFIRKKQAEGRYDTDPLIVDE